MAFVTEPAGRVNAPLTVNPLFAVNNPVQLISGKEEGKLYGVCSIAFVIEPDGKLTVPLFNPFNGL